DDVADDVFFCSSSYGLADYIHVPEPLLDYRLHEASRTEHTGGGAGMQSGFLSMSPKLRPILEKRGVQPLAALAQAIQHGLDELDWQLEDWWYRKGGDSIAAWWDGRPRVDDFFFSGLLDLPGFPKQDGAPPLAARVSESTGHAAGRF